MIPGIVLLAQLGGHSPDAYAGEHYQKDSRPCTFPILGLRPAHAAPGEKMATSVPRSRCNFSCAGSSVSRTSSSETRGC